jgi:exocyst complex component 4
MILQSSQFNNVDLALSLLDDSSAGKGIESFRQTKVMLSHALKGSVDSKSWALHSCHY